MARAVTTFRFGSRHTRTLLIHPALGDPVPVLHQTRSESEQLDLVSDACST